MNKPFLILLIFVLSSSTIHSQQELSEKEKLFRTAKVWGFLKYYHPNVAKGKFDWDKKLIELLPKIEKAKSKADLSIVFSDLVNSLGKIKECRSCKSTTNLNYFNKNFNLSWTQDSNMFTNELSKNLKHIENNRFQGKSNFVTKNKNAGNVILINETDYQNFDWKDKKLRILSLFRYWNTIEYFFPYKYQMDKNWNQILKEMLPKFLNPQSEMDYHLAMLEIIVDLDDSHAGLNTNLTNDYFGSKYIPVKFSIVDNKAVITSFYNDSLADINDLRIGDVIEKANGKTVNKILQQKSKFIQGSNTSAKFAYAFNKIFNGVTDSIEIELLRNDKIERNKIGRYSFDKFEYKKPSTDKWKMLENNIGYINLGEVEVSDVSTILEEIQNTKSIIFDLRNYPKFTLPYFLNFLNPSTKELLVSIIPDLNYPGKFYWEEPMSMGENNNNPYRGKVIILVNSRTISYAELYAMGLQTVNNSFTIGSQTLGADGNVSRAEFIGGFKTGFSGIGIFYPDFTETQRKGVRIDIEVKPTILGIKQGRDEVLEKAIKVAVE